MWALGFTIDFIDFEFPKELDMRSELDILRVSIEEMRCHVKIEYVAATTRAAAAEVAKFLFIDEVLRMWESA